MQDFLTGLAFVLIIEGVLYALFPDGAKRMMDEMQKISTGSIRLGGLSALAIGVVAVWLIRN